MIELLKVPTNERSTLSKRRQNGVSTSSFAFGGVYVRSPRQQQRNRRKDQDAEEDAKVPWCHGCSRRFDDEADRCQSSGQGDEGSPHLQAIRQPADEDDVEEAEEVGRS